MSECEVAGFALPEDGWFNIATRGEWPHKPTGLTQIIDDIAADEIIKAFTEFRAAPNWPGVLVDFDHQSLDQDKPTVAAGWIVDLQKRDNGLWAQIRWSDIGQKAIEGGRYRFISPVWRSSDCAKLDNDRVRPLKLMNCAVTNDPNIRGLFPLSNSAKVTTTISAPPMDIAPTMQGTPTNPDTKPAPPSGRAMSIPAPFSNAILANRTAWTPAETRRRYRFALANAGAMSDDQRRAMFARMGQGGPGDHGYGYAAPSASVDPEPRPNPFAAQTEALRQQRDYLKASLKPAPERPHGFNPVDVDAVVKAAMSKPGATATDIIAARDTAKAENEQRKKAWRSIEDYYRNAYKDKAAGERALQKYEERMERQYKADLADWQKLTEKTNAQIAELDSKIIATEAKAKARDWDDTDDAATRAQKERDRLRRQQIEQDRIAERQRQAEEKALKEEAQRPIEEARREAIKPKLFWTLVEQGNKAAAMQLYPNVNYAQAISELNQIKAGIGQGTNDKTAQAFLAEFRQKPPPMVNVPL